MWLLKSENGEFFHVLPNVEHTVSRKDGSIILKDDQSISRRHAKFCLNSENPNDNCGITVVDMGSKYGTFIIEGEEEMHLKPQEKFILKNGNVVRFGLQWNKWRAIYFPVVVLTSALTPNEKSELKIQIEELGGQLVNNWSTRCTHLTMSNLIITVKAVCALAAGQHIVTQAYWHSLTDAIKSRTNLPDPEEFIPPLKETTLNENQVSFKVNKERANLFKSVLFVAATPRQLSRIEPMVTAAGGKTVIFSDCKLSQTKMCTDNVMLMQNLGGSSEESQQSQIPSNYSKYVKFLNSKGLRCIPEQDIGLSIVYCSREMFCNPKYRAVLKAHPSVLQPTQSSAIIVPETQNTTPVRSGIVINETVASTSGQSKRLRESAQSSDEEERRCFKKPSLNLKNNKSDETNEKPNKRFTRSTKVPDNMSTNGKAQDKNISIQSTPESSKHSIDIFGTCEKRTRSQRNSEVIIDLDKENLKNSTDIFGKSLDSKKSSPKSKTIHCESAVSSRKSVDIFDISENDEDLNINTITAVSKTVTKPNKPSSIVNSGWDSGSDGENNSKFPAKSKNESGNDDDDDSDEFSHFCKQDKKKTSGMKTIDVFGTNATERKRKISTKDDLPEKKQPRCSTSDDVLGSVSDNVEQKCVENPTDGKQCIENTVHSNGDLFNVKKMDVKNEDTIKKEPVQFMADEDISIHNSTVVVVKSLVCSIRNIKIRDNGAKVANTSVNFKRFSKNKKPHNKLPHIIGVQLLQKYNLDKTGIAADFLDPSSSDENDW